MGPLKNDYTNRNYIKTKTSYVKWAFWFISHNNWLVKITFRFSEMDWNGDGFISPFEFDRDLTVDAVREVKAADLSEEDNWDLL